MRIIFRFLFVVPLFILAVDGIRPGHTHDVNSSTYVVWLQIDLSLNDIPIGSQLIFWRWWGV